MFWCFSFNSNKSGILLFFVILLFCVLVLALEGSKIAPVEAIEEEIVLVEELDENYVPYEFQTISDKRARDFIILANSEKASLDIIELYRDVNMRPAVIAFFEELSGDLDIASTILFEASEKDVSPALAFAVAYKESRFRRYACNQNSKSVDRGLFQLNSLSFPQLSEDDFYDININVKHGIAYLASCLAQGGNEITALAAYNAGLGRISKEGAPRKTLSYIDSVLDYKDCIEALFEVQVVAKKYQDNSIASVVSDRTTISD